MYKNKVIDYNSIRLEQDSKVEDSILRNVSLINTVNKELELYDTQIINTQYKLKLELGRDKIQQVFSIYLNEDYTTHEDFKIYVSELLNTLNYNIVLEFIYEDLEDWDNDKYEILNIGSKVSQDTVKGINEDFEINIYKGISFYGKRISKDSYSMLNYGENTDILEEVCLELVSKGILNSN